VRAAAGNKPILTTRFTRQADSHSFQVQFAEAAVRVATARQHVRQGAEELDRHGAGGFAEASPLHRIWQDVNIAARHAAIAPAVAYGLYGKALLGVDNDIAR
jgi:hypothetical protein